MINMVKKYGDNKMSEHFDDIIKKYEHFDESNRLFISRAKNIEFINSIFLINKFMKDGIKILDCSSGPGTYSLYLAKNFNCNIVSTDLVEKYIEELNVRKRKENLKGSIQTLNLNAANLSRFKDDTFDIVLCMGAYYHLIDDISRECCLKECIRVLKKNGYLFLTYLPLSFILKFFALNLGDNMDFNAIFSIKERKYIKHTDYFCQFTDIRYDNSREVIQVLNSLSMDIVEHMGIDGDSILYSKKLEEMSDKDFTNYCKLVREIYSFEDTIGMSNHAMVVARKR